MLTCNLKTGKTQEDGLNASKHQQSPSYSCQVTRCTQINASGSQLSTLDTTQIPFFFLDRQRKKQIKGWRDFTKPMGVSGSRSPQVDKSSTGHGTHVISLAMQVAPAADIYVARVARDTPDLEYATENIAQAITWAAKTWQADIIFMSFGFDDEIIVDGKPVISNAISYALSQRSQKLLFFAAAANDGGNRAEMFPARHPNVISVRGTDSKGWMERFNAPPGVQKCIMTLGKDVPGAALCSGQSDVAEVCRSGTSVSTPIAAGIAATLLGYAKLHEGDLKKTFGAREERFYELWTMPGMRRMLGKISTPMGNHCSYLKVEDFEELNHELRLARIATVISSRMER